MQNLIKRELRVLENSPPVESAPEAAASMAAVGLLVWAVLG